MKLMIAIMIAMMIAMMKSHLIPESLITMLQNLILMMIMKNLILYSFMAMVLSMILMIIMTTMANLILKMFHGNSIEPSINDDEGAFNVMKFHGVNKNYERAGDQANIKG